MQRILIVDDERDVRDSVKCVLDDAGYVVLTADNAADAVDKLGRTKRGTVVHQTV
jgi:DNA-binding NtrC family response regulator